MKHLVTTFVICLLSLVWSCAHEHSEEDGHNHGYSKEESVTHTDDDGHNHGDEGGRHSKSEAHGHEGNNGAHDGGILLSQEQAETIGLEFGEMSSIKVNDFVKATGTLGLPPNAYSSVSAKSNGIIKGSKKYVEGNYIKKGEIVAYLENAEFIVTQQNYLETKAELKLKQLEVDRQKTLVESNAGVIRNLQNAQAELAVLEAKHEGLAKQLSFLGIIVANLSPGNIQQQVAIVSPMSGYISKINFHNGMYAQMSVSLMDIISSQHLHLELDVFEKDVVNIKEGQKISYMIPALGDKLYYGEVSVIGKEFDSQTKTIRVHGHLEDEKPNFLKDLFINAKIWLNDSTVDALPEKAIIKDGESAYVYVAKDEVETGEIEFQKMAVIPGATNDGFTAVKLIVAIPDGMKIVTNGAYYVYAQSKAGELEHEH